MIDNLWDSHVHAFPPMPTTRFSETDDLQLKFIQLHTQAHIQGWRRKRDNARVDMDSLRPVVSRIDELPDVDFRVGTFGRLECTIGSEDFWLQWYPCWLEDMSVAVDAIIAYMNYVGVRVGVLQHDHVYGSLNSFLSQASEKYPSRLLPLAQIEEWRGGELDQIDALRYAVEGLGHRGLYFALEGFAHDGAVAGVSDPALRPLWDTVRELGIPIFWYAKEITRPFPEVFFEDLQAIARWAVEYPEVQCVITHAMPTMAILRDERRFRIPSALTECLSISNLHMEVLFPLYVSDYAFPFSPALQVLEELVESAGPTKLIWGSDMPAAERTVTYRQSIDYVARNASFMTDEDKSLFFGGNLRRVFGIAE